MRREILQERVELPDGVVVSIDGFKIKIKGPKGELQKELFDPDVKIESSGNAITFTSKQPSKSEKRIFYTLLSHLKNMVYGVVNSYIYKLKVCYVHFPVTVKIDQDKVFISNFLGEKIPRKATILEGVVVKISGDIISVEGIDIEKVSQTAANIEIATRITRRDRRRFQDGCYIIEKAGVSI